MSDFILNIDTSSEQAPVFRDSVNKTGNWKQRLKIKKLLKHKHKKNQQSKFPEAEKGNKKPIATNDSGSENENENRNNLGFPTKRKLNDSKSTQKYSERDYESDESDNNQKARVSQKHENIDYKTMSTSLFTSIQADDQKTEKVDETDSIETRSDNVNFTSSNNVINSDAGFPDVGILQFFANHLKDKLSISKPTEIQRLVLSNSLSLKSDTKKNYISYSDRDSFIRAETGSGKTLSYLLPIINRLLLATQDCQKNESLGNNSKHSKDSDFPSRNLGTMAIILTPTRELAKQVYETTTKLVNISRSSYSNEETPENSSVTTQNSNIIRSHWIVTGVAIGGDKKQSEKARLRKGVTILACTPGRLLDHLKTTTSFRTFNLKWLVLDEADQLLELGFQDTLNEIIQLLSEKSSLNGELNVKNNFLSSSHIPKNRINILCSATLKGNVKKLAQDSLKNPIFFNSHKLQSNTDSKVVVFTENMDDDTNDNNINSEKTMDTNFDIPDQLMQDFILVPPKLKLVALASMLDFITSQKRDSKIIVFLSCRDSVNFYYDLFSNAYLSGEPSQQSESNNPNSEDQNSDIDSNVGSDDDSSDDPSDDSGDDLDSDEISDDENNKDSKKNDEKNLKSDKVFKESSGSANTNSNTKKKEVESFRVSKFLKNTEVYRLHGSLSQPIRSATISKFTLGNKANDDQPGRAKVLFCTDVASRGLDLPLISHIIQYDAPTDLSGYVHRVGRTARLGQMGKAVLFIMPPETEYLNLLLEKKISIQKINFRNYVNMDLSDSKFLSSVARSSKIGKSVTGSNELEALLKVFSVNHERRASKWMDMATELQLAFEKFVLSSNDATQLAKSGFTSSVRAYATHSPSQKHIFHIKNLHLGHYAKSFGLREAPKSISVGNKIHSTSNNKQLKNSKDFKNNPDGNFVGANKKSKISEMSEFAVGTIYSMVGPRTKKHKKA
ncbi:ATP-dependent RNA helicase dbp7 [Smittium culicis]|uniref:ATP-dependent RNA helicase n=1 Tax=Smittium culicis TaxID=133412 RepID=A0A1R1XYG4_9FUNG|nr:ATP-dependent RNA helicase dbp7 [Smittium culicis]